MDIGGAALYSIALMAARGLSHLALRASRVLASAWHSALEGAALYSASLYGMPQANDAQSDDQR